MPSGFEFGGGGRGGEWGSEREEKHLEQEPSL